MADTPGTKESKKRYKRDHTHKISITCYPKDEDVWMWWSNKKGDKQQWIRDKIREEIDKEVRHADEYGFPED